MDQAEQSLCIITGNQIVTQLTWPQSVNSHSITSVFFFFFFPGPACAVKYRMALIWRFMPHVFQLQFQFFFQLHFKQASAGHITTTIMELCKFMSYFKKSISHKKMSGTSMWQHHKVHTFVPWEALFLAPPRRLTSITWKKKKKIKQGSIKLKKIQ